MKIALTGVTGHLGSAILPELFSHGYYVNALVRGSTGISGAGGLQFTRGELMDKEALRRLLTGCDALIHCAAVISVNGDPHGEVHRINVDGTKLLLETALEAGIKRVLHVSSIHAYQQAPARELLDESRPLADESAFAYDRSKREGQQIALSMNSAEMEVLVVNPTSIIGPYDHKPSKMGKVIIDLCTGKLPFVFNGGFDFCDCRDVAQAIVNALEQGRGGENYLLAGKWYHFNTLAELLSAASGKKIKPVALPAFIGRLGLPFVKVLARLQGREPLYTGEAIEAITGGNQNISSKKAIAELGYHIRPFEETIRDTYQWFLQNGYLVRN